MENLVFLDFEASGLDKQKSYPISVAYGRSIYDVKEYLINPSKFKYSDYWDKEAEKLHGISRRKLYDFGMDPEEIFEKVFLDIQDDLVYAWNAKSNNIFFKRYHYDLFWASQIADVAKSSGMEASRLELLSLYDLMSNELENKGIQVVTTDDFGNEFDLIWDHLKKDSELRAGREHNAKPDVENSFRLWEFVKGMRRKD